MSRLSKDFKSKVKQEFREYDYVGGKVLFRFIIVCILLAVIISVGGVIHKKWKTNQDREIFKESVTYTEGAATFLADSYRQYNNTDNESEKTAIMQYVIMRYPDLDTDNIDNVTLKQFYNKCLLGGK